MERPRWRPFHGGRRRKEKKERKPQIEHESAPHEVELADRITDTIKTNNFHGFMELITNSPRTWCTTRNSNGSTLLQEAIKCENFEIFDNMLLCHDMITLEATNGFGETALHFAITHEYEYHACEIIRKGAFIHEVYKDEETFLHIAVRKRFKMLINLLLEKGINVNAKDDNSYTALHTALLLLTKYRDDMDEIVPTLLHYGADPLSDSKKGTPLGIAFKKDYKEITNMLLLYAFDNTVNLKLLFIVQKHDPSMFHEILQRDIECTLPDKKYGDYVIDILMLDSSSLHSFLKKFQSTVFQLLEKSFVSEQWRIQMNLSKFVTCKDALTNLNMLIEISEPFSKQIVKFINNFCTSSIFWSVLAKHDETEATKIIIYLLSNGLKCYRSDVDSVFVKYGYCELFKFLLHMDVQDYEFIGQVGENLLVSIICDHDLDLEYFLDNANKWCAVYLNQVLNYFAHSELSELLLKNAEEWKIPEEIQTRLKTHPKIPRLAEMCRNIIRKHIGNQFNISNTIQFYTLVNNLPICPSTKKIITFETKLY